MSHDPFDALLAKLSAMGLSPVTTGPGKALAFCAVHENPPEGHHRSLAVTRDADGKVLLCCRVGCQNPDIVKAMGNTMRDLYPDNGKGHQGGGGTISPAQRRNRATVQSTPMSNPTPTSTSKGSPTPTSTSMSSTASTPMSTAAGLTLAQYAEAKRLPVDFLRGLGLSDVVYMGQAAIRIPYRDEHGEDVATRFRLALSKVEGGDNRFCWKKGSRAVLYGLWKLCEARKQGHVLLVEGESDSHTCWHHGIPTLGLPGAANWKEPWAVHLADIPTVYVIVEPDAGGDGVLRWLAKSAIREKVRLVHLDGAKDPSELYLKDPTAFRTRMQAALDSAKPWTDYERAAANAEAEAAWAKCSTLAQEPDILARFAETLRACGVAGEERMAKLLYLALTSRLLERPVSVALKGPSSGGKSYLAERVLSLFPESAYFALSAMSERALAYSEEPLSHRFLVIYEAAGLQGDFASYLVRSLLSEGRLRYETVDNTKDGMKPRLIERAGPTGLIVTTTAPRLHPENETRLLSVTVTDSREQTKEVMLIQAQKKKRPDLSEQRADLSQWTALQTWMGHTATGVSIPYAEGLARAIPPVAVRLRRDFPMLLT